MWAGNIKDCLKWILIMVWIRCKMPDYYYADSLINNKFIDDEKKCSETFDHWIE